MNEVLTMAEIEARFPKEWVLLGDPVKDQHQRVQSGKLLWHGKDRDEGDRQAIDAPFKHIAIFFTGPVDEDAEFTLGMYGGVL
jgi:hypothetical protein